MVPIFSHDFPPLENRFNKRGESPLLHASAKSNVGHEEANAGTCGFIKAGQLHGSDEASLG